MKTSNPIQSNPIQSNPIQSNPIQSNPIQSNPIQSNPIQSNPIQSNPIQSNPIQSNPIQSNQFNLREKMRYLVLFLSMMGLSMSAMACEKPPVSGFDRVDCLKEGLAGVKKNGKWGFVNQIGQLAIPIQYDEVGMFTKGVALVNRGGQIVFINKAGQSVIPPSRQYGYARELRDSVAQP